MKEKVEAERKKEDRRTEERAREEAVMAEAEARESAATALLDLTESAMRDPPEPATRDAVVQTDLTTCHIRCLEEKFADVRAVEKQKMFLNAMRMLSDFILAFPLTPGSKLFLTWHLVALKRSMVIHHYLYSRNFF